jgi:hypothetical protein
MVTPSQSCTRGAWRPRRAAERLIAQAPLVTADGYVASSRMFGQSRPVKNAGRGPSRASPKSRKKIAQKGATARWKT